MPVRDGQPATGCPPTLPATRAGATDGHLLLRRRRRGRGRGGGRRGGLRRRPRGAPPAPVDHGPQRPRRVPRRHRVVRRRGPCAGRGGLGVRRDQRSGRRRPRRCRGRGDRPRVGAGARADAGARRRARAPDPLGDPGRRGPLRRVGERTGRPRRGGHRHDGADGRDRAGGAPVLGHRAVVRVLPGPPHLPADRRVRRRDERHRRRRGRDPGALLPPVLRPLPDRGATRSSASSTCRQRAPHRRGGRRAAHRPAVPGGRDGPRPRVEPGRPADPRVGRARRRARPHPRLGGGLRRHLVARPLAARDAALRLAT
jgi:hypothetical protein